MFFTSKRKKVARKVHEHIWPFFGTTKMTTGLPPTHFKSDPYILGFVVGAAGYLARAASDNSLSNADTGFVTIEVLEELFGKPGVEAAQQQMHLLKQGTAAEFQRGIANGQKTILAGLGAAEEMKSDPDVKAILAAGEGDIAVALQKRLFYNYVVEKYGER